MGLHVMMKLINFHYADLFAFSVDYEHLLYMNKMPKKLEDYDCHRF